jgi:hypothetical protein
VLSGPFRNGLPIYYRNGLQRTGFVNGFIQADTPPPARHRHMAEASAQRTPNHSNAAGKRKAVSASEESDELGLGVADAHAPARTGREAHGEGARGRVTNPVLRLPPRRLDDREFAELAENCSHEDGTGRSDGNGDDGGNPQRQERRPENLAALFERVERADNRMLRLPAVMRTRPGECLGPARTQEGLYASDMEYKSRPGTCLVSGRPHDELPPIEEPRAYGEAHDRHSSNLSWSLVNQL